jgi:hypothetical protein
LGDLVALFLGESLGELLICFYQFYFIDLGKKLIVFMEKFSKGLTLWFLVFFGSTFFFGEG